MNSRPNNVLKPINTNMQSIPTNELSASKRLKANSGEPIFITGENNAGSRWSLNVRNEESDVLAEMGVGVLEPDENISHIVPFRSSLASENEHHDTQSSSPADPLENDHTNPDLIVNNNLDKWMKSTNTSPHRNSATVNSPDSKSQRREMMRNCLDHEIHSIIRRRVVENPVSPDFISKLPDELILQIFKYLSKSMLMKLSMVSKQFCRLARDESLWARLDLSMRCLYKGALGQILNKQVQVLKLAQTEIESPAIISNSAAFYDDFRSRLQFLDLSSCVIAEDTLALLFKRCYSLKKLSLENVKVNDEICLNLSQNENIEVLNMVMVSGLTFNCMKYLIGSLSRLKELNIGWTHLNEETLTYVTDNLPKSMCRLNISGCRRFLNDNHVQAIVNNCPYLRELDLSDCTSLTPNTIEIISPLHQLNFLALSRCYGIAPIFLLKLKNMQSLAYFDVHGHMNDAALNHLKEMYADKLVVNKFMFSSVARPTVGIKRTSIWNMRVRD